MNTFDEDLPFVSCFCPTFGRPHLLEEAIESFLLQDYAGRKELIILNDLPEQKLIYKHPDVRIMNVPKRIVPLGKKFNECVKLCKGDVLFVWDDDDIYLPWRLSFSIQNMRDGVFHSRQAFFESHKDKPLSLGERDFHCTLAIERQLFTKEGGYAETDLSSNDLDFMRRLGISEKSQVIDPDQYFYIYRWGGTGSYHGSGLTDWDGSVSSAASEHVENKILSGECPTGSVRLYPHWSRDWLSLIKYRKEKQREKAPVVSFDDEILETDKSLSINWESLQIESTRNIIKVDLISALVFQSINGRRTNREITQRLSVAYPDQAIAENVYTILSEFKSISIVKMVSDFSCRLKIAVLTQLTTGVSANSQNVEVINEAYAEQAGYDFHIAQDCQADNQISNGVAIHMLRYYLPDYDYVLWLDPDAAVTRFNISIEHFIRQAPNADLLASDDQSEGKSIINTGVVLVRNSPWSHRFLEAWWECRHKQDYAQGIVGNQQALSQLYQDNVMQVSAHLKVFTSKMLHPKQPGLKSGKGSDYILHLSGTSNSLRDELFSDLREKLLG